LQTRGVTDESHVDPVRLQFAHATPLEPHAPFVKPGTHPFVGSQHPGHVVGEQGGGGGAHRPPRHTSPRPAQLEHACPATPHWLLDVPGKHTLPTQHPGQFWGPHVCWQAPPKQVALNAVQF
jgi:hypothetical protein